MIGKTPRHPTNRIKAAGEEPSASSGTSVYGRLRREVIDAGLCTHCGTCVGLAEDSLTFEDSPYGPLPIPVSSEPRDLPEAAFGACPGRGLDYPELCEQVFGRRPKDWLLGVHRAVYVGYSLVPEVRRRAASGGVITQSLLHLLESGQIEGAVVVRQGSPRPWQAEPVIARSPEDLRQAGQSVYVPVPVNEALGEMASFDGRLAYVGLPDQVASLRRLQVDGHAGASKVRYVLGPYVGTAIYREAVESFLRSHGVESIEEVTELRYRDGEWPGSLRIRTRSGRELTAEKFYYNYLIPFYVTRSSLLSVDFTNELTDVSVGDAWHPRYEQQGQGFAVVVARSERGERLLGAARDAGLLRLEEITVEEALSMHGHMLDFKKRGSFVRMKWRSRIGKEIPDYGYRPERVPLSRELVEVVISSIFALCGTRLARRIVEMVPLRILGPLFNVARKTWKRISKPTKRSGLGRTRFVETGRDGDDQAD